MVKSGCCRSPGGGRFEVSVEIEGKVCACDPFSHGRRLAVSMMKVADLSLVQCR